MTYEVRPQDLVLIKELANGHTLPKIAVNMGVSFGTIKTRAVALRRKMKVQNNVQLVAQAYERRILIPSHGDDAMEAIGEELRGLEEVFVRVAAHIRRLRGL